VSYGAERGWGEVLGPVVERNVLEVSTRFWALIPTNRLEVFSHFH